MGAGTKIIIAVLVVAFIVLPLIFFIVSLTAYNRGNVPMEKIGESEEETSFI